MNAVILTGRLATDPELKYTPSGVAVCEFRLAVDRSFKNASGEREADFFTVKMWRDQAESAANYLEKGRKVGVEGRLEVRSWVAQDGSKRSVTEVVAQRFEFLDSKRNAEGNSGNGGNGGNGGGYRHQPPAPASTPAPAPAGAPAYDPNSEPDFGDPFADS